MWMMWAEDPFTQGAAGVAAWRLGDASLVDSRLCGRQQITPVSACVSEWQRGLCLCVNACIARARARARRANGCCAVHSKRQFIKSRGALIKCSTYRWCPWCTVASLVHVWSNTRLECMPCSVLCSEEVQPTHCCSRKRMWQCATLC